MNNDSTQFQSPSTDSTRLGPVLLVTVLMSVGSGVLWNGVPFIAANEYGYERTQSLIMMMCAGAIYVGPAFFSGKIQKLFSAVATHRTLLQCNIAAQALFAILPMITHDVWALWIALLGQSAMAALLWPVVESYVTSGRHGIAMRRAIGWFNVAWMGAMCGSMMLLTPFMEAQPRLAMACLFLLFVPALLITFSFGKEPGAHDETNAQQAVPHSYQSLLAASRVLLPISYVINATMSPLLPYLLTRVEVDLQWQAAVTAIWMVVRLATIGVMWWLPQWHGKWSVLTGGGIAMAIGFALLVLFQNLAAILVAMLLLGIGFGIIYYAALYYVMSVGRAGVEAGGTHEAIIGMGYTIGPLLGLGATAGAGVMAKPESFNQLVVGLVWIVIAAGVLMTWRLYQKAKTTQPESEAIE